MRAPSRSESRTHVSRRSAELRHAYGPRIARVAPAIRQERERTDRASLDRIDEEAAPVVVARSAWQLATLPGAHARKEMRLRPKNRKAPVSRPGPFELTTWLGDAVLLVASEASAARWGITACSVRDRYFRETWGAVQRFSGESIGPSWVRPVPVRRLPFPAASFGFSLSAVVRRFSRLRHSSLRLTCLLEA
jgi:hypothetical protein